MIEVRRYEENDKKETMAIWNAVVREGVAFPQDEELTDRRQTRRRRIWRMAIRGWHSKRR